MKGEWRKSEDGEEEGVLPIEVDDVGIGVGYGLGEEGGREIGLAGRRARRGRWQRGRGRHERDVSLPYSTGVAGVKSEGGAESLELNVPKEWIPAHVIASRKGGWQKWLSSHESVLGCGDGLRLIKRIGN